jgi:hypothetical protein
VWQLVEAVNDVEASECHELVTICVRLQGRGATMSTVTSKGTLTTQGLRSSKADTCCMQAQNVGSSGG